MFALVKQYLNLNLRSEESNLSAFKLNNLLVYKQMKAATKIFPRQLRQPSNILFNDRHFPVVLKSSSDDEIIEAQSDANWR